MDKTVANIAFVLCPGTVMLTQVSGSCSKEGTTTKAETEYEYVMKTLRLIIWQ